ncbi:metal-dependent protein hydrolase [Microthyrium microscopicum]|uniref:Metal-dependent protein hydrolase n=1 Tax=Microthyrium microscopicum TaxID=703497 RepID=A0A6A6U1M0_9PEZI|nr:metal-dependent protein hydrolase [Microthyrium microscopicum]
MAPGINPSRGREEALNADAASQSKRQKLDGPLIGTHNGHFHADEALAVHLLRILPTYTNSPLVRTRDPATLASCHTVVDVGGTYDASANRFDHHQREFTTVFPNRSTKLSAAGLVYMHHGPAIIAQLTGLSGDDVALLHEKLYADFIEAFDANDNGIDAIPSAALKQAGLTPKFDARGFTLAAVVNRYNHTGDAAAEEKLSKQEGQALEDERFMRASRFVGEQFELAVSDAASAWLPARGLVREAYGKRFDTHASGQIVVLPHRTGGLPWADHLYEAEAEAGGEKVSYVLFPESGADDSKWRVRAVSVARGEFSNRKDLPDAWKGVRDEELSKLSGIPGCVFVHAGGFIGGNQTFDGALAMAVKAVEA